MKWIRVREWLAFSMLGQILFWKEYTTRENKDPKTDFYHVECKLLGLKQTYRIPPIVPILKIIDEYKLDKYGVVKS